jgi:hypothetical protein
MVNGVSYNNLLLNARGGSVGICTSSPATRLALNSYVGARLPYVNGTSNTFDSNGITVGNLNNGNTNIGGGIDFTNNCYCIGAYSPILSFSSVSSNYTYNNAYAGIWGVFQGAGGDANWNRGDLAFGTSTAYGLTEKMRIKDSGNVGIGTCNPLSILHIQASEPTLRITDSADSGVMFIGNTAGYSYIRPFSRDFRFLNAAGVSMFSLTSTGIACFACQVCTPLLIGTTVSTGGLTVPRASLHGYGVNATASTIMQTGTQRFSMIGKYIQSYGGTAVNVPLFVACGMANTGIMVKVDIYGSNAVSAMRYEDAGYAGIYYIGGGLQGSPNASVVTICNLGGVGHTVGTLYWGNTGSNPVLYYCQANNGYIGESLDVHITIRDSANIYFCSDFISCG